MRKQGSSAQQGWGSARGMDEWMEIAVAVAVMEQGECALEVDKEDKDEEGVVSVFG